MRLQAVIKKYLTKGRFSRNIALLASGTIISQLIVLATIPILSRIYDSSDFGILATYASILGIISVIASLRYELAIPLAKTDKEAVALLILCIIITIFITLIVLFAMIILEDRISIWLLPIGVFFAGLYQTFNYWAIREKDLKVVAKTKVSQAVAMIGVQVIFFKYGSLALILGHVFGKSAGVSSLVMPIIRSKTVLLKKNTFSDIMSVAKRYKKFPLISSWAGLLNSIGNLAPNLLFALLYSPSAAGLFFIASRITSMPISLLGVAIGQSFYAEAVESNEKERLASLTKKTAKKLFMIIIIPMLVIFMAGEEVTTLILGIEWRESGKMVEWLSFLMAAQFITAPIGTVFSITEQQLKGWVLQLNLTILRIGSIFIAFQQGLGIVDSVMIFSVTSSIGYLIFLFYSVNLNLEKINEKN
jgi:O-antigen/teichoic acid export membrane protein